MGEGRAAQVDEGSQSGAAPRGEGRFARQVRFILEIDRLKSVRRRSYLADGSRLENSAEHSWHLAVMAMLLSEHAALPVDPFRVVKMLLVHDIVEIDAGDTFLYDADAARDKAEREARAAERLFALLPEDQAVELRSLWEEFEARETPEARFARALDRLEPMLLNFASGGRSWREHGVRRDQVVEANRHTAEGSPAVWEHALRLIDEAARRGYLK